MLFVRCRGVALRRRFVVDLLHRDADARRVALRVLRILHRIGEAHRAVVVRIGRDDDAKPVSRFGDRRVLVVVGHGLDQLELGIRVGRKVGVRVVLQHVDRGCRVFLNGEAVVHRNRNVVYVVDDQDEARGVRQIAGVGCRDGDRRSAVPLEVGLEVDIAVVPRQGIDMDAVDQEDRVAAACGEFDLNFVLAACIGHVVHVGHGKRNIVFLRGLIDRVLRRALIGDHRRVVDRSYRDCDRKGIVRKPV